VKSPKIKWLSETDPPDAFPDPALAFDVPDGLLAAGADLSTDRLLYAYRHGIFPWYDEGQPILWWSPDPRCVLRPDEFHVSRRLRRYMRNEDFEISFNQCFADVVAACAEDRIDQQGTWISGDMKRAYTALHDRGWAHSVEIWSGERLVGGLYGVSIGSVFFGESMFSKVSNASKVAMFGLCRELVEMEFSLLDCQVESPHLLSLGASLLPRSVFLQNLQVACGSPDAECRWPRERRKISSIQVLRD
jgi:leucyl/phenylalanyl-tRNA--protein transferase